LSRLVHAALALTLSASQALAADDALSLYQSGKFGQAIAAASSENTAPGFALAARATLADAMMQTPCLPCLQRAEAFARKAIAANPKFAEGHVYLAVSLGYQARIVGVIRARLGAYPEEARRNLDAALASDPGNAQALAALGGWNIEIVRGGGAVLAKWLYGASVKTGLDDFAAAFRSAPGNLVIRYQYALSLGGLSLTTYRAEIMDALSRAVSGEGMTAYDAFAQSRARELLTALKKNDDAAFARLVRRDQGYP
jgi:tetratricopeptide (TPR) repeat protein